MELRKVQTRLGDKSWLQSTTSVLDMLAEKKSSRRYILTGTGKYLPNGWLVPVYNDIGPSCYSEICPRFIDYFALSPSSNVTVFLPFYLQHVVIYINRNGHSKSYSFHKVVVWCDVINCTTSGNYIIRWLSVFKEVTCQMGLQLLPNEQGYK